MALPKPKKMFEKAIELDPSYPEPYGSLSFSYFLGYIYQWDRDPGVLDHAANLAEKAIALDDSWAMPYALRSWIAATKGHWETAHAYGTRAVSLEPNNAFVCLALANVWGLASHPKERIEFAQKGMRLDPLHSETYWGGRKASATMRWGAFRKCSTLALQAMMLKCSTAFDAEPGDLRILGVAVRTAHLLSPWR
jgi:tetratricopeptide (TPR) repeat protein